MLGRAALGSSGILETGDMQIEVQCGGRVLSVRCGWASHLLAQEPEILEEAVYPSGDRGLHAAPASRCRHLCTSQRGCGDILLSSKTQPRDPFIDALEFSVSGQAEP